MSISVRIEVWETLYQLLNYCDEDMSALFNDLRMRYGNGYKEILDEAKRLLTSLGSKAAEAVQAKYEVLKNAVLERLDDKSRKALCVLSRYMGLGGREDILRIQFSLLGLEGSIIDELIEKGVLMHKSRDILFVPEYLIRASLDIPLEGFQIDLRGVLQNLTPLQLAIIESIAFGVRPVEWLFKAIYGVGYKEALANAKINRVLNISSQGEPVLNPAIDILELRSLIHELKDKGARNMKGIIMPHGQYGYVKAIRCGVEYTAFGGSLRGLLILCPWIMPSKRLLEFYKNENRAIIIAVRPSEHFAQILNEHQDDIPPRTGFIFLHERKAYVYKPRLFGKSFDSMLDFLYRSRLEVEYLN